jgi:pimeloyl-ACP methyl ester carboxylesterase
MRAAERLEEAGFGTLLFDLLTEAEAQDRRNVFDIPMLGRRVVEAVDWVRSQQACAHLPIGLFGASTGAAAAIVAAMERPGVVEAVVSRGGRPDLADGALDTIGAPTLLIVGSYDEDVLALNRRAMARMRCETNLEIVPHAGHLFEEEGTLEVALDYAADWFATYLGQTS